MEEVVGISPSPASSTAFSSVSSLRIDWSSPHIDFAVTNAGGENPELINVEFYVELVMETEFRKRIKRMDLKKIILLTFFVSLSGFIVYGMANNEFAARSISSMYKKKLSSPVLSLSIRISKFPFNTYIIRDDSWAKSAPVDEYAAKDLAYEIKDSLDGLARSGRSRRAELYNLIYKDSVLLSYYFENSLNKDDLDSVTRQKNRTMLRSIRKQGIRRIKNFLAVNKDPRKRARAYYHLAVLSYLQNYKKLSYKIASKIKTKKLRYKS